MAFPVVQSVTVSVDASSSTSHSIAMPATVNAGDILLAFCARTINATLTWDQSSLGTWTLLDEAVRTSTRLAAYWKVADGTEDSGSLTITLGLAGRHVTAVYRITGGQSVETSNFATGATNNAPNPPALNPSWGSADNLWLVAIGHSSDATPTPAAEYTANHRTDLTSISNGTLLSSYRTNASGAEDPSAWSLSASRNWIAGTFAVRPTTDQALNIGFRAANGALYTPSLVSVVDLPIGFLGASGALFAPALVSCIAILFLAANGARYAPTLDPGPATLNVGFLGANGTLYAPSLSPQLAIPLLAASGAIFFPTVIRDWFVVADSASVNWTEIPSSGGSWEDIDDSVTVVWTKIEG